MSDHVRFRLLGPLEAWSGDVPLDLGPPKRRLLLVRLLAENGIPVSADRLCDDLWEGRPPASAVSSIHAHISRLRTVLEPERMRHGRGGLLVSGPGGYTLKAPPDSLDSTRFENAVNGTRAMLEQRRLPEARHEIERGLSLWRGAALADAAGHAFAAREISRLEEIRMTAGELNATVLLHQGEYDEAVFAAEELTERSPLREAAWALLMRALYLAGRPAEALRRHETIRALLADELGAVPGPELSRVHMAVLRHDLPDPAPVRRQTVPAAPAGRPAAPLVGRARELSRFDEVLLDTAQSRTRWVILSGEAGIGKTRLAEEFAARAAEAAFRVMRIHCDDAINREEEQEDEGFRRLSALCPRIRVECGPDAALRDLTERLTGQPTICLIEDLHRADRRLRHLIGHYATLLRDVPLVVVCTTQDTDDVELRELLALLARRTGAAVLPLEPLTVGDVHELMKRHSTPSAPGLPGDLHRREAVALHRRGEGNPFLITEILDLPGDERTGPGSRLPATVGCVLRSRLDRLDARALRMLEAIAVTGGELDPELLLRIRPVTRDELPSLIDAAVIARVLKWEDGTGGRMGRYVMPALVREVVLHDLTPARRQGLHAAAATALTELPHRHPAQIARHLMAAGPLWFDRAAGTTDDPCVQAEAWAAANVARR